MLTFALVRPFIFHIIFLLMANLAFAQDSTQGQTLPNADTTASVTDSAAAEAVGQQKDTTIQKVKPLLRMPERKSTGKAGIFFVAMATFLLFGLLRYFNHKYVQELIGTLQRSSLRRLSMNAKIWHSPNLPVLFICIYFLSLGFLLGKLLSQYNILNTGILMSWLIGLSVVLAAFGLKYLFLQAVAMVFRFRKTANIFFQHIMIVNQLMGYLLLPMCGMVLLVPNYLLPYLMLIVFIFIFLGLVFKYLINFAYVRNLSKVNYVHFILYLCVFEFIPLAVIARYAYDGIGV